jgi:signal transduction histidine kinase
MEITATAGPGPEAPPRSFETAPRGPSRSLSAPDLSFLMEATRVLAESLDLEATLARVARLSLPHLGTWCVVDLCEDDHMRRLAIIHPDPGHQSLADQLLGGWPPQRDNPFGVPSAVRTRCSEVVSPVTDEMLVSAAGSPENLAILRALQIGSFMTVPLLARGRVLGAITYFSPNHGDSFSAGDLVLAEELAARCGSAVDTAWLLQAAHTAEAAAVAAQAAAEEANLVKMRFLSAMSHELRTPLNAIAGYAELLAMGLRGPLDEAQLADVERIRVNQRHLLGLVESVLSFAKIDAGRVEFGLEDVSLGAVLVEVEGIVAPLALQNHVACDGCMLEAGTDVIVYADREKTRQILVNLLGNAIKFSEAGGRVEVAHREVGDRVEIDVSDQGIGIAPEQRGRIFEPFIQLADGYTRSRGGTGLGLAISRELAIGMGGCLSVQSEVGRGSTFTLTLERGRG